MNKDVFGLRRGAVLICFGSLILGAALPAEANPLMQGRPQVLTELFPEVSDYDPVSRALLLGLTPEIVDAQLDRAMLEVDHCDKAAKSLCNIMSAALRIIPTS